MKLTREYKREKLEGVVREHRMKFGNQQNGPVMGGKIGMIFTFLAKIQNRTNKKSGMEILLLASSHLYFTVVFHYHPSF